MNRTEDEVATAEAEGDQDAVDPGGPERERPGRRWVDVVRRWLPFLAALLVVLGLVAFWQAERARDVDHVDNHAVVDATRTAEVQSAISQALVRVFSYDYSDPAPTERAADELLAGDAREEYDLLFASLEERAPGQQLVLSAQVQVVAVKELTDNTASLLVFLDQASQRASDDEASYSAAQLAIEAELVDGVWKVTGLTPL